MVTSTNEKRITISNYSMTFNSLRVFDNFNLDVHEGEFVCILGPNGCGKSTLIKSLAGLIPYEGNLSFDGTISLVGQNHEEMLLPWLNVTSNIIFPKNAHSIDMELCAQLLETTKLKNYADFFPYQLSGGMQQLALIARSLLHKNDILLLDEPFKSLDFEMAKQMQMKVLDLWSIHKPTVLMVSHDIDEAIFMADTIIVLSQKPTVIKKIIEVNLPRKRTMDMLVSDDFMNIKKEVVHAFTNL